MDPTYFDAFILWRRIEIMIDVVTDRPGLDILAEDDTPVPGVV